MDENGYATFISDGSQTSPLVVGLAGSDGDGIVDIDEPEVVAVTPPVAQPAAPAEALPDGEVLTGLSGHGCSVGPVAKVGSVDPTLTTFMGLSMFMMVWRAVRRKVRIALKR